MNKVQMQSLVDVAMANDNVVDANEMASIVAQVKQHDITAFEINSARSLLVDSQKEVANDTALLASATSRLQTARLVDMPAAQERKSAAEGMLATAQNRNAAYQTLVGRLTADADPNVVVTANQLWATGADLDHAGHVIVDGAQSVGDRLGSALSHAGQAAGQIFRDLFGHH